MPVMFEDDEIKVEEYKDYWGRETKMKEEKRLNWRDNTAANEIARGFALLAFFCRLLSEIAVLRSSRRHTNHHQQQERQQGNGDDGQYAPETTPIPLSVWKLVRQ